MKKEKHCKKHRTYGDCKYCEMEKEKIKKELNKPKDEMNKPKKLTLKDKGRYTDSDLSLSNLDDENKCHIMTYSYGEVVSVCLNKTQIKQVIKWLERWVKFKEKAGEKLK